MVYESIEVLGREGVRVVDYLGSSTEYLDMIGQTAKYLYNLVMNDTNVAIGLLTTLGSLVFFYWGGRNGIHSQSTQESPQQLPQDLYE